MAKVTVDFSKAIRHEIDAFKAQSDLMNDLGVLVVEQVSERFDREGDPDQPWPDLKAMTKQKRKGTGYHILRDTGNFQDSVFFETRDDVVIVSAAPNPDQKWVHQEGFQGTVNVKGYQARVKAHMVRVPAHKRRVRAHKRKTRKGREVKVKASIQSVEAYKFKMPAHIKKVKAHTIEQDIPARPILRFTDSNMKDIAELITDFFRR